MLVSNNSITFAVSRVITLEHNNEELRNTNGCYLVTQISSNPNSRLTQIIRPKQACYKRICLSFPLSFVFVSPSCRRPRFAIARYGFNTNVAS